MSESVSSLLLLQTPARMELIVESINKDILSYFEAVDENGR